MDKISIQLFIICVPSQQLRNQLQKEHSVDTGNYTIEKEKHKDNSHKANFGNSAVAKLLFLSYTTHKSLRVVMTRQSNTSQQYGSYEKTNKINNCNNNKLNLCYLLRL
jgi:hypothetical protein